MSSEMSSKIATSRSIRRVFNYFQDNNEAGINQMKKYFYHFVSNAQVLDSINLLLWMGIIEKKTSPQGIKKYCLIKRVDTNEEKRNI